VTQDPAAAAKTKKNLMPTARTSAIASSRRLSCQTGNDSFLSSREVVVAAAGEGSVTCGA
jgi:hypothetical protein